MKLQGPAKRTYEVDAPIPRTDEEWANMRNNSGLPKRTWDQIDDMVMEPFRWPNTMYDDLFSQGLTNGNYDFGDILLQWEKMSDMTEAQRTMDGRADQEEAAVNFDLDAVPLPVTHKAYSVASRKLDSSRNGRGPSLDMALPQTAGRKVFDSIEDMICNGDASIKINGAKTIYGYTTHPNRNTFTIANNWDTSTPGARYAINDLASMLDIAYQDDIMGPFGVYINKTWYAELQRDYSPESGQTYIDRMLAFDDVQFVHVGRKLASNEAVLVDLSLQTVELAYAVLPDTISWTDGSRMTTNFFTYAVMVPKIKADYDGKCGIVHGT